MIMTCLMLKEEQMATGIGGLLSIYPNLLSTPNTSSIIY